MARSAFREIGDRFQLVAVVGKAVFEKLTPLQQSQQLQPRANRLALKGPCKLFIMEGPTTALSSQHFPSEPRHLQNAAIHGFHHPAPHAHATLASQLDPNLQSLDPGNAFATQFHPQLGDPNNVFEQRPAQPRFHEIQAVPNHSPRRQQNNPFHQPGQFGVLTPNARIAGRTSIQHDALGRLQQESGLLQTPDHGGAKTEGHFANMKVVPHPPGLEIWRERLFNVDETITMSEEEFQTYFPHVDNIYSHRSTQRYKRKPFISHYWDCRLKGRPPGTPKSEDPTKRKRKRQARERDLCDVKIKITEYFPGARTILGPDFNSIIEDAPDVPHVFAPGINYGPPLRQPQPFGMLALSESPRPDQPGSKGERYYTIQRVNGNGGNGKGDGVAGPHKHTLEESDRVKKNSIQRHFLKEEKQMKKSQKTYHKRATGTALTTVKRRSKDHELKLFGSCFCPFVQRVWIALEVKGLSYQYVEVDPYKKPESLLEINPRGLVPALRHGDWGCYESTVLMEYLEDLNVGEPLLPQGDAKSRADCRLWTDHINRKIVPAFYRYLQEQNAAKQIEFASDLKTEIAKLVDAAHAEGPFFLGPKIGFVDIQIAPWMLRLNRVLKPYRGWPEPEEGSRWRKWTDAIEKCEEVKATTSTDDLYLDSYERYAENRPDTSELAKAVNSGRGLP